MRKRGDIKREKRQQQATRAAHITALNVIYKNRGIFKLKDRKDQLTDSTALTLALPACCTTTYVPYRSANYYYFALLSTKRFEQTSAPSSPTSLSLRKSRGKIALGSLSTLFALYYLLEVILHCDECFGEWAASGFPRTTCCLHCKKKKKCDSPLLNSLTAWENWKNCILAILDITHKTFDPRRFPVIINEKFRWH